MTTRIYKLYAELKPQRTLLLVEMRYNIDGRLLVAPVQEEVRSVSESEFQDTRGYVVYEVTGEVEDRVESCY